jgi:3-dehydroquinate dehydratase-2
MKTIWVLNGPNLNLLGVREPAIYGHHTLEDVRALCEKTCAVHGFSLEFRQTNHEGTLVDWVHEAGQVHAEGNLAGLVINAGAYTHTSIALADAIKATGVTLVEVHISNVFARESFRHHSYLSPLAKAILCGFGIQGYALAIAGLTALAT